MKISKNFLVQEFVPHEIYDYFGKKSIMFTDPTVVHFTQKIRDRFNVPIYANSYYNQGRNINGVILNERGYRLPLTKTGAKYSEHKNKLAIDLSMYDMTAQEFYADIFDNEEWYMGIGITTVEDIAMTPTWVHLDRRFTGMASIKIVVPLR